MTVRFYQFNKKINSTKQPGDSGMTYDVKLKDSSSILHPTFICSFTSAPSYNYCYVAIYNRYYYLVDWTYYQGLWSGEFTVDVLASWKTSIGNTGLYIIRSSELQDKNIADTMYPADERIYQSSTTVSMPWDDMSNDLNGYVILSMLSRPANMAGLSRLVYSPSSASTFINNLYNGWESTIIDPTEFLRGALWVPYRPTHTSNLITQLKVGGAVYIEINGGPPLDALYETFTLTIDVPDSDGHGILANWRYHEPFSSYELDINPWGVIELNSYEIAQCNELTLEIRCDNLTGQALLRVKNGNDILYNSTTQLGVQLDIGGSRLDAGNIMSAVGSVAGALTATTPTQLATGVGSFIGSGLNALQSRSGSTGGSGGWSNLFNTARLTRKYMSPVQEDSENNGMPCCKWRTPAQLGGYMIAEKGLINISGTDMELREINSYLTSGFYYE